MALVNCVLFALLGLVLAAYRSGITFDREAGEAVQWQRLLLPVSRMSLDLRRFTTVSLKSEVREVFDNRTNRRRPYRAYLVKLTEPRGSELDLGQGFTESEARAAGRQVADLLGLELVDATAGDAPLPTAGAYLAVELPGGLGPVSISSKAPPAPLPPPASVFRECQDQPPGSRVTVETFADGVTLKVPPAGVWAGSKGLLFFGLLWSDITISVGTIFLVHMSREGRFAFWPLAGIALLAVVGLLMIAGAIHMGRRRAVLAVVGGTLMLVQTGPLGTKKREWPRQGRGHRDRPKRDEQQRRTGD